MPEELLLSDLERLKELIEKFLAEPASDRREAVAQQIRCIATVHLNYNREILEAYAQFLKREGFTIQLRRTLT